VPRPKAEEAFALDLLTANEKFLLVIAKEAEHFTKWGWRKFGDQWQQHIPTLRNADEWASDQLYEQMQELGLLAKPSPRPIINLFTRYFLNGFSFQRYQAYMHYCPIPDIQIMGGVGSGKTTPSAISAISRATLNPGYGVLWVAPILPQAKLSYEVVLQWGSSSRWGEVFLLDNRRHPYPLIQLRPWDRHDPGSVMECRSLGQDPAELLRGGEYDEAIADEGMRSYATGWYIALIAGRLRGPKPYMLNAYPKLRDEYSQRVEQLEWAEDQELIWRLEADLERWLEKEGLAKQTRLTVIGNPPRGHEWWRRWERGLTNPGERYSARWSTYQNRYVTKKQLELQERQFAGREEERKVELEAARPPAGGDVFPYLETFFSGELLQEAIERVAKNEPGWVVKTHEEIGLYHYEKPPEEGASYMFALDPGAGIMPKRNKWVLMGVRVDRGPHNGQGPFEIVYIQAGNFRGAHGSPSPWIAAAKDVRSRYPIAHGMFGVESSGVQKNTHQVVWPDDLVLVPIMLNNVMMTLIIEAQRTVGADMWSVPDCPMFSDEMSEFSYKMDKNAPQDFPSAFLILNHLVYPLVHERWEIPEEDDWEEWRPEELEGGREVRESMREVRVR